LGLSPKVAVALAILVWAVIPAGAFANHSLVSVRSIGPNGGNGATSVQYVGASADGRRVYFRTSEALVASDTDDCTPAGFARPCYDIYERFGTTTTLLSTGPNGGNGSFDADFLGNSADGTRVLIGTAEALVSADTDSTCGADGTNPCGDIYEHSSAGSTTLLTTGPNGGNGPWPTYFSAVSADGSRVTFGTRESLVATDTDSSEDVYEHSSTGTAIVSTGPAGGNGAFDALLSGSSADGSRLFFRTAESLVSSDTDSSGDVYERSGGTTTIVSTGPAGGNGTPSVHFDGASADGTRVFFTTEESLVSGDTDNQEDVYQRSGGTTTLISTGTGGNGSQPALFEGTSQAGTHVFFRTKSSLVASDTDNSFDVYDRSGGATTLISTGPAGGNGAFDANFSGASADGAGVFFTTAERLVSTDVDSRQDVYQRLGGTTTLLSTGPAGGSGAFDAYFAGASTDGVRVFFHTDEALTTGDTDSFPDVYERYVGATTLISTASNGGQATFFVNASDDGKHVLFYSAEQLATGDTDSQQDIYDASIPDGYSRPLSATPVSFTLVPVFEPCTTPNGNHAAPWVGVSCNPPRQVSPYLTVGTPDANGNAALFNGSAYLKALGESPITSTNGDQADIGIEIRISDIRRQSDLLDYAGELQLVLSTRMTDRLNGNYLNDPATATDVPLSLPVPCTPTGNTSIGSSCNLSTTLESILPGTVTEAKRSIWQITNLEVRDGGADGDADTGPNSVFLKTGLFAP
jgi:hypothetical protein